ncbi:hypothetical protein LTS16_016052 [Friedmanniomyces endolithicus]|nr:hypothetical protein LTS09_013865 [Friedmanniomyces endolithicus]KAK0810627.1 hypothetical protein LTR59_002138 [Friedmanniomyces endolithicus]KAK0854535.1 hypothetical protein LTR03_002266 [Friedmanniomyces endolithicus]KAK0935103.1 hypothetical protein LTR29_013341 [Friedmanniomyces endolithicus]KAK0965481.1 hypothetical protein LTS01_018320 [Friedmanniomyces endolithicus]
MEITTINDQEQQSPALLRIARELRNNIYDHTMPASKTVLIQDEYPLYYFQTNTFYFTDSVMKTHILDAFLACHGGRVEAIKSVRVYIKLGLKKALPRHVAQWLRLSYPFSIRFQMTGKDGVVTVQSLKTTQYTAESDRNNLCCCYLTELAALGTVRSGGLVAIIREFIRNAAPLGGPVHLTAAPCSSCGGYKSVRRSRRIHDQGGVSA